MQILYFCLESEFEVKNAIALWYMFSDNSDVKMAIIIKWNKGSIQIEIRLQMYLKN